MRYALKESVAFRVAKDLIGENTMIGSDEELPGLLVGENEKPLLP